ncbi:hypothetical protein FOQG_09274 [Fusarium oxysporum f. sp. raphani 54005]|uniref:Uncharacterized protein n=1 Tax=Fusarium oxysporum f. sp. raphani 54005 TaxID=1089458 RepID=X0CYD4_FUSOX|nr:hypothetical protein FOQG_09274 [Fusarium oxysporum f. sp. raphani 54005]
MRNKHWVTISSREKDTVNRKGNVTRHTSFFKKTLTQIQTAMIRTIHFQCRLDEHDGPQPPFGPPPSPIKHQCRNLEPLFPLIANHLLIASSPIDEPGRARETTVIRPFNIRLAEARAVAVQLHFSGRRISAVTVSNPAKTLEDHLKSDRRCDDRYVIHAVHHDKASENPSVAQKDWDEISVILVGDTILKIAMSKGDWANSDDTKRARADTPRSSGAPRSPPSPSP